MGVSLGGATHSRGDTRDDQSYRGGGLDPGLRSIAGRVVHNYIHSIVIIVDTTYSYMCLSYCIELNKYNH